MRKKSFTYDGRSLEVRAAPIGNQHVVRVYEKGSPANSIEYTVTFDIAADAVPWDLVADLMDSAKNEFIRWSDWRKGEEANQHAPDSRSSN